MSKDIEKILKVRKLIIISAIVLIVLVGAMTVIFFSKSNMAKIHVTKVNSLEKDYSDYIMPLNRNEMINAYHGEMSRETMYTLMYEFSLDVLPQFRKSANENIDAFFEENKEYIYIKTGIDNVEEYKLFVEKIKHLPEELSLSKTEIKEGSVEKKAAFVHAVLVIYYNDGADTAEINIKLENALQEDRTSVIFK